ncbi:hypothetical protein COI96_25155 [Priestia megaterium]|uniref:hypothetical protein n=1 Tax=Priestia megaterium TaxID=1404 RepID=UPI000BF5FBC8|nr:hypothetical protein [Priestia megaterium]PFJ96339.1 hypothetical protein COI96_25155 [Priestia megaterium]
MQLKDIKVKIKLPYVGNIQGTWEPNDLEKKAAWEMYIELITRVSVLNLKDDEGLLRESLSSLYSIFDTTREILKRYGPKVAIPNNDTGISFGYLSVTILNTVLRPLLSKWHPLLLDYENKKEASISILEHEKSWAMHNDFKKDIEYTNVILKEYIEILSKVAGVPLLVMLEED